MLDLTVYIELSNSKINFDLNTLLLPLPSPAKTKTTHKRQERNKENNCVVGELLHSTRPCTDRVM